MRGILPLVTRIRIVNVVDKIEGDLNSSRKAVHILEENLKQLQRCIGNVQEDFDNDNFNPADVKTGENMLNDLENEVLAIENLIERIKMWPAKLYNIGMSLICSK